MGDKAAETTIALLEPSTGDMMNPGCDNDRVYSIGILKVGSAAKIENS
jgi:hypothetical protein